MSSRDRDTKSLQDKLKVFFKKGASAPLPAVNELVVTAELERELRSDGAPARRLRALRDLGDRVRVTRIQQGGAERLWVLMRDLLDDGCAESRHTALWFLRCIAEGQECAVMRTLVFRYLRETHAQHAAEDAPHRLSLLSTLTNAGKNIECFEEQIGEYLLEYMRSVGETGPAVPEILALVINVVKYNATYLDEHVVHGIVDASCHLCAYSAEAGAVVSALALLEAVVAYSLLPRAALPAFVGALCRTVNLERHCQTSWKLMRSVLGADLGHAALQELAALPAAAAAAASNADANNAAAASNADANNAAADAGAVRGAVFYINMALWGPRRVPSLRVSLLCVLPALLQAVSTNQPVVTYEVIQAIQSLVTRAPPDSLCAAWDVLLAVLAHAHRHDKSLDPPNELIHTRLHALLTSIEQLHEAGQYTGDTGQLLDLIDSSAQDRPEASVVRLITLRCATLSPGRADWLAAALALGDKFVRRDTRLGVRMHALQQLLAVVKRHRFLYEEEVVVGVVVPLLGWCGDPPLRAAAARAAAELAVLAAGDAATDLIDLLEKIMNRPFESEEPNESDPEPDLTDVSLAVSGLLEVFHAKLLLAPAAHAARACLVLLDHLDHALNHPRHPAQHATCRKKILDMIFGLRANAFNSVGFCYDSAGNPVYGTAALRIKPMCSPSLLAEPLAARGHHPPPTNHPVPGTCILPVGRCARILTLALSREKEWSVLLHVLRALPALLQSRALCVGRRAQDLDLLASTLCAMLSDRSLAFPECLRGQKVLVSELHAAVLPSLGALAPYHAFLEPLTQQRVVRCLLRYGMVLRTPAPYLAALTQFTLEARDTMVKLLPEVLLDLSKVSDTKLIAGPMLEFLSTLTRLPRVFASFVEDQYMSVFAILLPYTNPSRYNHYVVSLAHHVVAAWFLKCRLSYRRNFVRFIIHGLHNYIIMPFEEQLHNYKVHAPANEDSSNRKRSSSLGSRGVSAAPLGAGAGATRASAASASAAFHVELTETCVDLLARYTASACSVKPQRSDAAEWMFSGGQSMTWLVGHKLVTITTAGCNMNSIKQGMCDRCATLCRQHAESAASPLPPLALHDEHAKLVPPSDGSHGQNHNNLQVTNPPEIKRYSKHSLQHSRSTDNSASSSLSDRPDTVPSRSVASRTHVNNVVACLLVTCGVVWQLQQALAATLALDRQLGQLLALRPARHRALQVSGESYSKHSLQHSRSTDNSASSSLSDRPDTVPSSYSKHSLQHSRSTDNSASSSLSDRPDTVPSSSYSKHSLQHSRSTDNSASSSLSDRPDTVPSSYSKHSLQHSRSTDNSASSSLSDRPDTVPSSYSKHSLQHSRSTDNSASPSLSDRPDTVPSRQNSAEYNPIVEALNNFTQRFEKISKEVDTEEAAWSRAGELAAGACPCWCADWAEVHVRSPSGDVSWLMRVQNQMGWENQESSLQDILALLAPAPAPPSSASSGIGDTSTNNASESESRSRSGSSASQAAHAQDLHKSSSDSVVAGERKAPHAATHCIGPPHQPQRMSTQPINIPGSPVRGAAHDDDMLLYVPEGKSRHPVRRSNSSPEMSSWKLPRDSPTALEPPAADPSLLILLPGTEPTQSQSLHASKKANKKSDMRVSCEAIPEEMSGSSPLAAPVPPPHPHLMTYNSDPVSCEAIPEEMSGSSPLAAPVPPPHPHLMTYNSDPVSCEAIPEEMSGSSPLAAPVPPPHPHLMTYNSDPVSCEAIPEEMSGSSPLAAPVPPPHPHLMTYNSDPVSCEAIPEEMSGSSPLAAPVPPPYPHLMTYNSDPVSCEAIPEEMSGSSPLAAPVPPPHPHLMTYNSDPVSCEAIPEEMSGSSPLAAPVPPPHPHLMTYNSDPVSCEAIPEEMSGSSPLAAPVPPPYPHLMTYNSDPGSGSAPEDGPTPQPIQKVASDSIVQGVAAAHAHKPPAAPRVPASPSIPSTPSIPATPAAAAAGSMKERDDLPPLSRSKRSNTISVMSPTRRHRDQSSTISTSSSGRSTASSNVSSSGAGAGGGVTPSFVLLQLYHKMSTYPITPPVPGEVPSAQNPLAERPLLVSGVQHERTIKNLDRVPPIETYKVGVLYVGPGQQDNEVEVLKNEYGSVRYAEFLGQLGTLVSLAGSGAGLLEGAQQQPLFLNLEQGGKDGKYTYVWHDDVMQVLFHVATAMPVSAADPTCNEKRKYIGNDYVSIVYNDSGGDFPIQTIKGQFNLCIVVVEPCEHGLHRVHIKTKDERIRTKFLPHLENCAHVVSDHCAATLARQLALHCALASHISQSLSMGGGSAPYASNSLERLRHIKRLRRRVEDERLAHARRAPKPYAPQGDTARRVAMDDFNDYT
ncbi:tuberin [Cydia splendana]|uniref:tuberin n=1 Tax=Cydia splendana TaxID=1100963 RepID=UPI00300C880B